MKEKTNFFIFKIAVLWKIFIRLILGFIIAFFIFGIITIFVRFDKMKSSAMSNSTKNSIEKNETVITSKLRYAIAIKPFVSSLTGKTIIFSRPKRGDIIFMTDPRSSRENFIKRFFSYVIYFATFGNVNISKKRYLIKRVIGLPNETIEIREKKVYINGSFLEESWANINNDLRFLNSEVSGRDNFGPYIIGYNEYFVLSDNRDYGYDSRDFGSVNFSFINGKVINR
ncbi:signal peptidase I [Brachyspira aalborgi]|jgi:signal peptidase I|uniref:Signal peptidase I n=1 Tax=Brachyspira aalborgi TaxID=29522 RepID=A0ABY3KAT8_9SPIR|nr:signal peptidase I [Brachyspira aalborgi]TXJ33499.1 signal peptidase I [Brachyspira aalborgi]TXJ43121.1 signal peptidase I [Brachyspira aalborgi]CCY78088.1 signal peptidase I [Brachyspira sp. CAG:700]